MVCGSWARSFPLAVVAFFTSLAGFAHGNDFSVLDLQYVVQAMENDFMLARRLSMMQVHFCFEFLTDPQSSR